jgi:tRNA (guanine-N7-)-methyltransferase
VPDPSATAVAPLLEAEELRERGVVACLGTGPLVLDVGFGRAELITDLALRHPERSYLGVEVSRKRVWKAGRRIAKLGISNVRLLHSNAEYLLERVLPPRCLCECWICFPDPWPKKRHFKRRLFQPAFMELLCQALEPGALVHAATDHAGYAEWIADAFAAVPELENLHSPARWSDTRPDRRQTGYEEEWVAEGRAISYFDYRRK